MGLNIYLIFVTSKGFNRADTKAQTFPAIIALKKILSFDDDDGDDNDDDDDDDDGGGGGDIFKTGSMVYLFIVRKLFGILPQFSIIHTK